MNVWPARKQMQRSMPCGEAGPGDNPLGSLGPFLNGDDLGMVYEKLGAVPSECVYIYILYSKSLYTYVYVYIHNDMLIDESFYHPHCKGIMA